MEIKSNLEQIYTEDTESTDYYNNLKYSVVEKYNSDIHGNKGKDKYLNCKYLSFDVKTAEETCVEFEKRMRDKNPNNQYQIGLYRIIKNRPYCFGLNQNRLIKKIQNLWRKYHEKKIKKFTNLRYLYGRQITS